MTTPASAEATQAAAADETKATADAAAKATADAAAKATTADAAAKTAADEAAKSTATAESDSLLPEPGTVVVDDAAKKAADAEAAKQAELNKTAANQNETEWFLSEGVKGEGPMPEWYKADKYKSVGEQAKAYSELEKRFGAFTGAPKDGAYVFKLPEGVTGEFDKEHPLFQNFNKWAKDNQLSQDGYNSVLGMFAEYEASMAPNMATIKSQLGSDADLRINNIAQWSKANLTPEEYSTIRGAATGNNAATVFKALEAVIAKTKQAVMPKANTDVTATQQTTEQRLNDMQAKRNDKGQRLYEIDPKYRAEVESLRMDFYKQQEKAA